MSKRKQETVPDIVAEMMDACHNPTLGIKTNREKRLEKFLKDIMIEYADRIEAAEKRENARLRAALTPVLDAYISQDDMSKPVYDSRIDAVVCVCAVREAKRIYNGGGESEVK